jgi:hypothetical protein
MQPGADRRERQPVVAALERSGAIHQRDRAGRPQRRLVDRPAVDHPD